MLQVIKQSYNEEMVMYMKLPKKKLSEMLIECNKHLKTLASPYGFMMLKDWFIKVDDGEGDDLFLAECPNCNDTVVYGDGCIKCNATFEFK